MAAYLKGQIQFWFSAEFFAVGVSAFAGVAIRVSLETYFENLTNVTYKPGYAPFMQIFLAQPYLVPNFLGCFIMAFCIANMKTLTGISTPLYKALTTGLCGCITTFASWVNGAVNLSFQQYTWYEILIMICLEFWLTWSAFTLGYTAAKLTDQFTVNYFSKPVEDVGGVTLQVASNPVLTNNTAAPERTEGSISQNGNMRFGIVSTDIELSGRGSNSNSNISHLKSLTMADDDVNSAQEDSKGGAKRKKSARFSMHQVKEGNEEDEEESEEGSNNYSNSNHNLSRGTLAHMNNRKSTFDYNPRGPSIWTKHEANYDPNSLFAMEEEVLLNPISGRISVWREDGLLEGTSHSRNTLAARVARRKSTIRQTIASKNSSLSDNSNNNNSNSNSNDSGSASTKDLESNTAANSNIQPEKSLGTCTECFLWLLQYEFYVWLFLFSVVAIPLWGILMAGPHLPYFQNSPSGVLSLYRSIALAPLGAWVRWAPTRLPQIKASWPEMNPQTMFANILAATLDCLLTVFAKTNSWTEPFNNGFNGSCSTVSTYFAEIHSLYFERGPYAAVRYAFATFALAIIIIQIIRGANTP